jgi:site-specific DNA recombinase
MPASAAGPDARGRSNRCSRCWRNRTYRGEVHFRGEWHPSSHPSLVERAIFDRAQAILNERGEDHGKRASNGSDYLLSGLVVCDGCGRHFCGTRATGRNASYRYYTCGGRQRHGRATCDADRLPADALDAAVVDQLLAVFEDSTIFQRAAEREIKRSGSRSRQRQQERRSLELELAKTEGAIDRYLRAFEAGSLPEEACGSRVKALSEQVASLRRRRDEMDDEPDVALTAPSAAELAELGARVRHAVDSGSPAVVKELLGALVHEVRVESRHAIRPVFRIPQVTDEQGAVRALSRSVGAEVGAEGLEPPHPCGTGT